MQHRNAEQSESVHTADDSLVDWIRSVQVDCRYGCMCKVVYRTLPPCEVERRPASRLVQQAGSVVRTQVWHVKRNQA